MATDPTSLVEGDDTSTDTAATDAEVDIQAEEEVQYDDEGNPIDPDEEIDLDDDLRIRVPKSKAEKAREAFLRQADYTRKTQELAEQRRSFDAERNAVLGATNMELEAFATVRGLQGMIAQYQGRNFAAELAQANANYDDDTARAIQAQHMHFQQLERALQGAAGQLSAARGQRLSMEQQETARRIEEGRATLSREIGWNDDLKAKLESYALGAGLSRDDLSDLEASPAAAKILHAAFQWHQHSQKTQAANKHLAAQTTQPAAKAGGSSSPIPSNKLDDRLSKDEWYRRREKQVQANNAR